MSEAAVITERVIRPKHGLVVESMPSASRDTLREVVDRVVTAAAPEKIILFGSWARGDAGPNSDIDLLVVKQCRSRRELTACIYRHLVGVGHPVDVVVVTPDDLVRYAQSPALVIEPALRDGKVVYGG